MNLLTDTDIKITEIYLAICVLPNQGNPIHRQRPSHGLAYNARGSKQYVFDGKTVITVESGDIIYLPKASNYDVVSIDSGEVYAINFDVSDTDVNQPFKFSPKNKTEILDLYNNAEHLWRLKTPAYMMKCFSLLYEIIYAMQSDFAGRYISKSKSTLIMPATDYINANYLSAAISIPQLSQLCGISETYFRRIFSDTYNTSPVKYITGLRLQRARELLLSQMYSVKQVSQLSGFEDESVFCRLFKKKIGMTPSEFKSAN